MMEVLYYCETVTLTINQSLFRPIPGGWGSQISRKSAHEGGKVVSPTHRPPLPRRKYSWYSFLLEAKAGRIMSMKNSNDTIGNLTRDLPACGAVPQPTAPPRAPTLTVMLHNPGNDMNLHRPKRLQYNTLFYVSLQHSVSNRGLAAVKRLETLACRY